MIVTSWECSPRSNFLLQLSHDFFVYPDNCSARAVLSVLVFTTRPFRVVVGFFFIKLHMYILGKPTSLNQFIGTVALSYR